MRFLERPSRRRRPRRGAGILAAVAALVNPREVDFVSARLRDYQYNPLRGFLASQASLG